MQTIVYMNTTQHPNSPLISLQTDLKLLSDSLKEISAEIMEAGLTKYPIFLAHRHLLNIGEMVFDKNELDLEWSINVCTIDDLQEKKILPPEKLPTFIKNFKNPELYACVWAIEPEGVNVVFFEFEK